MIGDSIAQYPIYHVEFNEPIQSEIAAFLIVHDRLNSAESALERLIGPVLYLCEHR